MRYEDRQRTTRREFLKGESTPDPRRFGDDWISRTIPKWDSQYYGRKTDNTGNDSNARPFEGHEGESGVHRGKGPRSYQRSDQRILDDINDRLCDNPYIDASEIDVEVTNGEVTLTGLVNDRESKRLAEDIGESIGGVKNVENRLRVRKFGI